MKKHYQESLAKDTTFKGGFTEKSARKISKKWLIGIEESNPAILDIFSARDIKPYRDNLAWSGEFAGKYLTSAYYIYAQTRDKQLKNYVLKFIEKLSTKFDGGYIGCFSKETRLRGARSQFPEEKSYTWDVWGHYHIAYGLLLWYRETGEKKYLDLAEKIARYIGENFYGTNYDAEKGIAAFGCTEMNLSIYHIFGILYNETGNRLYLEWAECVERDFEYEHAGNWLNHLKSGKEFYLGEKPRWEALHVIAGFAEMYKATEKKDYLDALKNCVYSILKTDVHNTGGFSTREQAVGNPFEAGAIETCCVVAFNMLCFELYKISPCPDLIDFLEIAHYNAMTGAVSPSGAWATYDTPMEGEKFANFHGCDFQSRPGAPLLNCCSVNYPRGVAQYAQWALTDDGESVFINGFEKMTYNGQFGEISVSGNYPYSEKVRICCKTKNRKIQLRIPAYVKNAVLTVNGKTQSAESGRYFTLPEECDVTFSFGHTAHFLRGGGAYEGKYSLYRGPVLFAYEIDRNPDFTKENGGRGLSAEERLAETFLPKIDYRDFASARIEKDGDGTVLLKLKSGVTLTGFCHCGFKGSLYKTWFETLPTE